MTDKNSRSARRHFLRCGLTAIAALAVQPARAQAPAKAVPADTKAYCKQMYGKAYMLCGMSDHDCKFLAADKWERCEQTGRWP